MIHPGFDPVALQLGPLSIHWYGLMYVLGFVGVYYWACYQVVAGRVQFSKAWTQDQISDLIFYSAIGVILGGRLGYVLFYKPMEYIHSPLSIFNLSEGGMSFHGGLLGVALALCWYARRNGRSIYEIGDLAAMLAPIGLFFGRIGNFINQELWGKPTDLPWGIVFHTADHQPRHPSMLYEAFLEGVVLFLLINWLARRPHKTGMLAGVFLCGYALFRSLVELVRVPDAHLNYIMLNWVTMGQILSLPMLLFGLYLIFRNNP